jgi:uncharacterized protein YecE (DUF72 family)
MAAEIRLGTTSFTGTGWPGSFYPKGMSPTDYLHHYSTRFDTVEIDSTFYRVPKPETVQTWAAKTRPGFIISLKFPRIITHEKVLLDCDEEFESFIGAAKILGEKLGPMLLEFPHFNQDLFTGPARFIQRLHSFFKKLPAVGYKFAIEVRNKDWLEPQLVDLLREYNVALVLQDQSWMPRSEALLEKFDPITADFAFIRWHGDHKGILKRTNVWNRTIFDRTAELRTWVEVCEKLQKREIRQYIYANNHYAGCAPATIELFRSLCHERGIMTPLNITPTP